MHPLVNLAPFTTPIITTLTIHPALQAVISANYAEMRIDIDAEESVHHVRLDSMEHFGLFLEQLQQHRLSVQHSLHLSVEEEADGEVGEEVGRRRGSTPSGPPSLPGHRASLVRGLRPARWAPPHTLTSPQPSPFLTLQP